MENKELQNNSRDNLTAALKGFAGAIPLAGGLVAEVIGSVIPRQRIDRIASYLDILGQRLETMEQELVRVRLSSSDGSALLEESFLVAYRARSDARRRQIANIVAHGISTPEIQSAESQRLLSILGDLNDSEIVVMQSYAFGGFKHYPFSRIHHDLLYPEVPCIADPPHVRDRYAMRKSYDDHLEQLGLIASELEIKESSRRGSEVVESGREITRVGIAFVRSIGGEVVE